MDRSVDVVCVGHAIVDVLATCGDEQIAALGLEKGTMTLVDEDHAEKIYAGLGPAIEASGGSAANTAACLASLGTSVQFIGKVADDGLGRVFTHDIRAAGVGFEGRPATSGPGTGRSLVMVTPDAERTMSTNLGVGAYLGAADVDAAAIASARVVYIEGYLCGKEESAAGVEASIEAARAAGTLVALSGSDPSWVELFSKELRALLDRVHILFANELEALGLSGCSTLDAAVDALAERCQTVAVTLGADGCIVSDASGRIRVPARPVPQVVDTTGAGDSFAAGFLNGMINGESSETCARLGALAAGEIVSHMGARPLARLSDLAAQAGLA